MGNQRVDSAPGALRLATVARGSLTRTSFVFPIGCLSGEFALSHAEISIAPRAPYAILGEEEVHERQKEASIASVRHGCVC